MARRVFWWRFGLALVLVAAAALAACGGHDAIGPDVGGSCLSNADCTQRCLTDADPRVWPGGFCTTACASDADCAHGGVCVKMAGGVCLLPCAQTPDCAGLGAGWRCDSVKGIDDRDRNVCDGQN